MEPILWRSHRFETWNLTQNKKTKKKKKAHHRHTQAQSYFFITFENFKNTHFPEHLLMATSVVNTIGNLTFHWSIKSGSLKRPVDLRNLITSLITSLFKPLELLLEPYSKYNTKKKKVSTILSCKLHFCIYFYLFFNFFF